jgi:UDP-glucose 4-epimerase
MNLHGKTILVTGGAGAIGSTLVQLLADKNKLIVVDDLTSGYKELVAEHPSIVFIHGSIVDNHVLDEAFSHNVQVVYHLAAFFANQNSVDFPEKDLMVNGMGTLKVLEWSVKHKVEKFVYASSSCVYGNMHDNATEDNGKIQLDTPYAISKYLGEKYTEFFHHHYKLNTTILRIFNSYGPGEKPGKYRNVIPNWLKLAMEGKTLPITGTGEETRDFNFVENTVMGFVLATLKEESNGQIFNIGGGKETTIQELAEIINEVTGNPGGIQHVPRRDWDTVLRRRANIDKARKLLGYEPKNNLREGVKATHEWFNKHQLHKEK